MARKAGKIYGTERDPSMKSSSVMINNNISSAGSGNSTSANAGNIGGIGSGGSGSSSALNNQNVAKSTNGN